MSWDNIKIELRKQLVSLINDKQSIRTIIDDVDSNLIAFIVWDGNVFDCWSGILSEVRKRGLELALMKATRRRYQQDEGLQKLENDIKILLAKEAMQTISDTTSTSGKPVEFSQAGGKGPIEVFISYTVEDEKFKNQLETHLALLRREGTIRPWHSQQAKLGLGRDQDIARLIDAAQIIILLISSKFLAEDDTYEKEMMRAIERQKNGGAVRVIPIKIHEISSGNPSVAPFQGLQGLPRNGRPVDTWRNVDEIWAAIATDIRRVCNDLNGISDKN